MDLIQDSSNHGTMVAGILGQYAPFVRIINLKVSHTLVGDINCDSMHLFQDSIALLLLERVLCIYFSYFLIIMYEGLMN